jgi:CheY-like chemotaxis protein
MWVRVLHPALLLFKGITMRIYLLADDIPVNNLILEAFIKKADSDCQIFAATSGEEALKLYKDICSSNYRIDAIFTDFNMPGMNGAELIDNIRGYPCGNKEECPNSYCILQCQKVPIMVVTADITLTSVPGANDILHKPIIQIAIDQFLLRNMVIPG